MFIFVGCFVVPVCFVMYFYLFIVKAVWAHESEMKNQAKKMGVDNLRQNGDKAKVLCCKATQSCFYTFRVGMKSMAYGDMNITRHVL